jgi:hypothetical protein
MTTSHNNCLNIAEVVVVCHTKLKLFLSMLIERFMRNKLAYEHKRLNNLDIIEYLLNNDFAATENHPSSTK